MNTKNPLFELKADIIRITHRLNLLAEVDCYRMYSDSKASLIVDRPTYTITVYVENPKHEQESTHEFFF